MCKKQEIFTWQGFCSSLSWLHQTFSLQRLCGFSNLFGLHAFFIFLNDFKVLEVQDKFKFSNLR